MCGIWARFSNKEKIKHEDLYHPIASLSHRGPDSYGWFLDSNDGNDSSVALVHTRLSIIDLERGQQPVQSYDHQWLGIINGELYDYKKIRKNLESHHVNFQSQSDSEVLLNQFVYYGIDGLKNIEGEFSFIFYHLKSKRLVFGRDLHGVKPLYFERLWNQLTIASEIKALSPNKPTVSQQYMNNYFTRILAPPYTFCEDVWEVLPGRIYYLEPHSIHNNLSSLTFFPSSKATTKSASTYGLKSEMFQSLPLGSSRILKGKAAELQLENALRNSVKKRLVADVDVGIYLSGGIDSALIAAMAVDQGARPKAFTVSFSDLDLDESKKAQDISRHLGLDHHIVELNGRNFLEHLILSIQSFEHPIANPHGAAKNLLSFLTSQYVKVVLTGDGADEWFGGYEYLRLSKLQSFFKRHPYFSKQIQRKFELNEKNRTLNHLIGNSKINQELISSFFHGYSPALFGRATKKRFFEFITGSEFRPVLLHIVEHLSGLMDEDLKVMNEELISESRPYTRTNNSTAVNSHQIDLDTWFGLRTDFLQYIVANVGDRQEMCHAIEGRTPFLDREVIKVAAALHPYEWMPGVNEKAPLKKLATKYFSDNIANRKKHAFFAPSKYFFMRQNQEIIKHYISLSHEAMPWINWKNINHFFAHQDRRHNKNPLNSSLLYLKVTLFSVGVLYENLRNSIPSQKLNYKLPTNLEELKPYEYTYKTQ